MHQLDQVVLLRLVHTGGLEEHFRESYECFTDLQLERHEWRACVKHDYARKSAPDVAQTFREHFSRFQDTPSANSITRESGSHHQLRVLRRPSHAVSCERTVLTKTQIYRENR